MSESNQPKNSPADGARHKIKVEEQPRHQHTFETAGVDGLTRAPDEWMSDVPSRILSREPSALLQRTEAGPEGSETLGAARPRFGGRSFASLPVHAAQAKHAAATDDGEVAELTEGQATTDSASRFEPPDSSAPLLQTTELPANLRALQHTLGNWRVERMLAQRSGNANDQQQRAHAEEKPGILHTKLLLPQTISRVQRQEEKEKEGKVQAKELTGQMKLAISQPGDKYEQEAGRVANTVMKMRLAGGEGMVPVEPPSIQRTSEADRDNLQRQLIRREGEEKIVQAKSSAPFIRHQKTEEEKTVQPRRGSPSKVIPDLDASTVEDSLSILPNARSLDLRQQLIDSIVKDRAGKGVDFSIMEQNKPVYVPQFPQELLNAGASPSEQGVTIPPKTDKVNPGSKPRVLIGPSAFGNATDSLEHRQVLFYTTITHEYQHVLQWKEPSRARRMSKERREVEAYFGEIENSKSSGLFQQKRLFKYIWDETDQYWNKLQNTQDWSSLPKEEREKYKQRYRKAKEIVIDASVIEK